MEMDFRWCIIAPLYSSSGQCKHSMDISKDMYNLVHTCSCSCTWLTMLPHSVELCVFFLGVLSYYDILVTSQDYDKYSQDFALEVGGCWFLPCLDSPLLPQFIAVVSKMNTLWTSQKSCTIWYLRITVHLLG